MAEGNETTLRSRVAGVTGPSATVEGLEADFRELVSPSPTRPLSASIPVPESRDW